MFYPSQGGFVLKKHPVLRARRSGRVARGWYAERNSHIQTKNTETRVYRGAEVWPRAGTCFLSQIRGHCFTEAGDCSDRSW